MSKKKKNICLNCYNLTKNKKFCSHKCYREYTRNKILESPYYADSETLKKILIEIHGNKCQVCGRSTWNDKMIPLELEHIDGNNKNNNWDNLMLLCCNCHAQTKTYCLNKKYRK